MTYNGFNYEWDDDLSDGMGGWRITQPGRKRIEPTTKKDTP